MNASPRFRICSLLVLAGVAAVLASVVPVPHSSGAQTAVSGSPRYYGINLASGSFASRRLPGVHGKDYIYPTKAIAEPFRAMGMNTIRLPVVWERLQPEALGPLSEAELRLLDKSIADLKGFNTVIVDIHNYARYRGSALNAENSSNLLPDLWTKLANRYKSNPGIAFGLMNEPHGIDSSAWRAIADKTVAAIRKTGARNLVLVPGNRWTGGHSWHSGGLKSNASTMNNFFDPANNFVFEIHQYLDADSSGTKKECVSPTVGRQRLAAVTKWLREQRAKALLAEFGIPPTERCLEALDDLLEFLSENADVWLGWTYWAAGDWWGNYPYSIQPQGNQAKPQAQVLRRHIANYQARATQ